MNKLKLDLSGLSLKEIRSYQDNFISTIGRLKNGLFTAEAAIGLQSSIDLLLGLYDQAKARSRELQEEIDKINITTEFSNES